MSTGVQAPVALIEERAASHSRGKTATRKTVIIVEDHPVFRAGIRTLIEPEFQVVGEFAGDGERLQQAILQQPSVAIVDVTLPGEDGISLAKRITELAPETAVLFISASVDRRTIMDALSAGAKGYVSKTDVPEMLSDALRAVSEGQAFLPPGITSTVLQGIVHTSGRRAREAGELSPRESEILRFIAAGLTVNQVAAKLLLSAHTVTNHLTRIYTKLGVTNRAQAVAQAIRIGLMAPDSSAS